MIDCAFKAAGAENPTHMHMVRVIRESKLLAATS